MSARPLESPGGPPAAVSSLERLGPSLLRAGTIAVWTYLWAVFLYDEHVAGIPLGPLAAVVVYGIGVSLLAVAPSRAVARRFIPPARMPELGLGSVAIIAALVAGDSVLAIRDTQRRARSAAVVAEAERTRDVHAWHGEIFPRHYFPTPKGFHLYKPNVRVSAITYGDYYDASMLASPTLRDSVLVLHRVSYDIGQHGVRELEPLAGTRIFALGDSFVFGYYTQEGKIWTDLLGQALHEPVYNLGLSSTGPEQQLQQLQYFLTIHRDSMRPRHLLWMIYEGNDLENSYDEMRPATEASRMGIGALVDSTVLGAVTLAVRRVKAQSMLRQLLRGSLTFGRRPSGGGPGARYEIDGVPLRTPLYHSSSVGHMLVNPQEVQRAMAPLTYVLNHPNRPALDATFRAMQALGRREGFRVTVIIAPSAARLYGATFDGLPPLAEPHFANYVVELAHRMDFETLNLIPLLEPYASTELLYYRDDHHWNERGNAVAAQLIAAALTAADSGLVKRVRTR